MRSGRSADLYFDWGGLPPKMPPISIDAVAGPNEKENKKITGGRPMNRRKSRSSLPRRRIEHRTTAE
jgi:hypothetical protein